jgi:anti-sigma factor RsiW
MPFYLDGELDAARVPALDTHLKDCDGCAEEITDLRQLRAAIRTSGAYRQASEQLRERVHAALRDAFPKSKTAHQKRTRLRWAMSLAVGIALGLLLNAFLVGYERQRALGDEVIAAHVRSLLAQHATDVSSAADSTVRPWFASKLQFAPDVPDMARFGYPLVGGRLDYIDHVRVAALVYRSGGNLINVFVWPAGKGPSALRAYRRKGYSVVHWVAGGMQHWAVSDLPLDKLKVVCSDLQGSTVATE